MACGAAALFHPRLRVMKHKRSVALMLGACLATSAVAAEQRGDRPSDLRAREIFARLISIPTELGRGKVPEMAAYLAQEFRGAGFPAEDVVITPFKSTGDQTATLVVRYRGDGTGGKPILFMAHMDVVTAKREDWERDPFQLVEENGYFFGRGAHDIKNAISALTSTFLRLKKEGFRPKRDLVLYFSGDEETSQDTTVAMVRDHRELVDAEFALNADAGGGTLDDDTGKPLYFTLQAAEKTYVDYTLTTRNAGGHSSQPRSDNAIYDMAVALTKVRDLGFPVMSNEITIAAFRAAARTTPGGLGAAMAAFATNPKDEAAAAVIAKDPNHVGWTRTTCVATELSGGHAPNALPQSAIANVNCRLFPGVDPQDVLATLQKVVGEGVEVKLRLPTLVSDASPLRPDVVAAVTRAVHKIHPGIEVIPSQSSGATDGLVFRAAGIPTYGAAGLFIRDKDDFSHGLNERIPIDGFYASLDYWYYLLEDMGGRRMRQ
jgi:acetylornithine deacetylase/succinyl-diaminopimelate desuccinylase-like protein